jgi:uncharacterized RDD family membrane protein YckC
MSFCPNCGTELATGAHFCAQCGARVETGAAAPAARSAPPVARRAEARAPALASPDASAAVDAQDYAGLGRRFAAHLVDGFLCLVAFYVIGSMVASQTGGMTEDGFSMEGAPALVTMLFTFIVTLAYFAMLESSRSGKTLGKLIAGIRVADVNGGKASFSQALIRNILRLVDGLVFYIVGIILILRSGRKQRLGDRVAGTVVLRSHKAEHLKGDKPKSSIKFSMGGNPDFIDP